METEKSSRSVRTAEISKLAGSTARVIDLHGRTATPGLIDSHGHFADGSESDLYDVKLSDAASIAEIVRRVGERAAALKPGEWVLGSGWDEGKLAELRYITAPDSRQGHAYQSGLADAHYGSLRRGQQLRVEAGAHHGRNENPLAGTIDRDAQGQPTGVLKEGGDGRGRETYSSDNSATGTQRDPAHD